MPNGKGKRSRLSQAVAEKWLLKICFFQETKFFEASDLSSQISKEHEFYEIKT